MKIVTTYIAFDDTEFGTKEACLEYEEKARNTLTFFTMAYKFYDKEMNILFIDSTDIDFIADNICAAYNECSFVYYTPKYLTNDVKALNREYLGLELPDNDEEGMYKYDWTLCDWEKID